MISWGLISCLVTLASFAILIIIYPLGRTLKKGFLPFIISLALIISFAYYRWGAFSGWQQHKQHEIAEQRAKALLDKIKSPEELINKLKAHLDDTPASARGWFLLGRLYSSQGDWLAARNAFAKAYQLNPQDEAATIYYANSLWQLNHQQFNKDIRALFKQLLQQNPNQPDALAMLALDAYESKQYNEAVNYWQQLLKLASPDSEEASALRKAIAKAIAQQA
ncbi:tetratricopeptide repeat protein [Legionella sp. CNM-1927-20]|uniref:tetratricopeptide repeat protein n=1 Tax=Legionella sp. CNM-1927-20 TaxID=3422221 RepID=UPI00403AFADF